MSTHQSYSIGNKKEEDKTAKDKEKPIPLFDNERQITIEELDKIILMPHKIDLNEYEISNTSSYLSEERRKQIEIVNEVQIEQNVINDSNSLSRGQVESDTNNNEEEYDSEGNLITKNRTGLDLLMLKNYNEHLPEQVINNNSHNEEYEEVSSSFGNSYLSTFKSSLAIFFISSSILAALEKCIEYSNSNSNSSISISILHSFKKTQVILYY